MAALPWPSYTHGELNEIKSILESAITTTRQCQRMHREMEAQEKMAQRQSQTPEQIRAATNPAHVYPSGQRFE